MKFSLPYIQTQRQLDEDGYYKVSSDTSKQDFTKGDATLDAVLQPMISVQSAKRTNTRFVYNLSCCLRNRRAARGYQHIACGKWRHADIVVVSSRSAAGMNVRLCAIHETTSTTTTTTTTSTTTKTRLYIINLIDRVDRGGAERP
ncbi:unnamed protein product [Trichogramma brassicae]|uniref:Uncharacterized protein n=1 Tax=Trichogramma brassicae TaxID=86971 RepID=A0A6H5IA24_9HYME|nr:unnamed protein product [Trichogramma brassicae]